MSRDCRAAKDTVMEHQKKNLIWLDVVLMVSVFGLMGHARAQLDQATIGALGRSSPPQIEQAVSAVGDSAISRKTVVIPAGTLAGLELRSIVNSRTAYPGQRIYCTTTYPIVVEDRVVVPVGSFVRGHVTRVVTPKRFKGHAEIAMGFDQIVMPNGMTRPMDAELVGVSGFGPETYSDRDEAIVTPRSKAKNFTGF
jgi:hypothetical protein